MGRIIRIICMLAAGAAIGIALTGFVIPIRLEVEVDPDKLYQYEDLTRNDVTVYLSPLFKRGKKINDFIFSKTSDEQYDDITIQQTIFYKTEHIRNVKLKSIDAKYQGNPREGETFDKDKVVVTAHYKDGSDVELTDYEVLSAPEKIDVNTDVVVKTPYGSAKLEIDPLTIKELRAEYLNAHEGDEFNPENVKVYLVYENGNEEELKKFEYEGEPIIRGKTDYKIYTSYGPVSLRVDPIPVQYAIADNRISEQEFTGEFRMVYEDGTEKTLDTSEIEFKEDPILSYGVNHLPFRWNGNDYTLFVYASARTKVTDAVNNLTDEISASLYNVFSNKLFVTIRNMDYDGTPYYLTHVILSDPSQIHVESANGHYGSGLESPTKAAARTGWTVGVNGSFFDVVSGLPLSTCLIRNNRIVQPGMTSGREVCLTNTGALFSPPAGVDANQLLEEGVKDMLVTTDPLLIQDGNLYSEGDTFVGGAYRRTAVGMVQPGEYYFVTSDIGLPYVSLQSIFAGFGCQYARSLDGGYSTMLMFKDRVVNSSTLREVADFLMIGGA